MENSHKDSNLEVINEIENKPLFKKTKLKKNKTKGNEEVIREIVRYYDTDISVGLSNDIVEKRIEQGLTNNNVEEKGKSITSIIVSNFFTFFNILSFSIGILLISVGSYENLFFLLIITFNLIIGIIQEIKAKRMIDKLSLLSEPTADIIRDGKRHSLSVKEIVLDDIIYLSGGKQISADCIVYEGMLEVDESLLTGESNSIVKQPGDVLLSGSYVISGTCYARVDKVGRENYIEQLSIDAKKHKKPKSELLDSLNSFIRVIGFIIIPLGVLSYFNNVAVSTSYKMAIAKTAGAMVGMIPAGLFLLTSVSLAVGVIRLAKNNTLVQELHCIETLARVDVLCLDKTGTITDGTMRVVDMIEVKNHTEYTIREIISSMMYAFKEYNPTSTALVDFFGSMEILEATSTVPFSSIRKYSAVTFGKEGTFILGAPEYVIGEQYQKLQGRVERFADQGFRVLVLAHVFGTLQPNDKPKNARAIALIVIKDHIREDAFETIEYFKDNGVDIRVISGDNPITVSKIATRAGVDNGDKYISLDGLSDEEVEKAALEYTVFGRVSPSQKRIIVKTLQEQKKVVAMTGDGVNDILALKEADISIAMASGSEATRYVSHLVLVDSKFSSMPKVVLEGRRVINNIQLTSILFLVKTVFSVLLTIMFLALGALYPFEPIQLIMIEYFAIGIPSFFLALQPNDEPVEGNFIVNVLKTTLPAALVVLIMNLILHYVTPLFNPLPPEDLIILFTTLSIYTTTAISFMVLFKVSRPFNWFRGTLFIVMVLSALATIIFSFRLFGSGPQNPFKIIRLDIPNIIFLMLLIETSYPLISGMELLLKKFEK